MGNAKFRSYNVACVGLDLSNMHTCPNHSLNRSSAIAIGVVVPTAILANVGPGTLLTGMARTSVGFEKWGSGSPRWGMVAKQGSKWGSYLDVYSSQEPTAGGVFIGYGQAEPEMYHVRHLTSALWHFSGYAPSPLQ